MAALVCWPFCSALLSLAAVFRVAVMRRLNETLEKNGRAILHEF
jgi:hypothetical protein